MLQTAKFPHVPSTEFHVGFAAVTSLVYHNPPLTPAAHNFLFVESLGSIRIARVLPPIVFGPLSTQFTSVILFA